MWPKNSQPTVRRGSSCSLPRACLGAFLAGCGQTKGALPKASAPMHVPSVIEVVGHYAVQMAQGKPLATVESRWYGGDTLPSFNPDSSSYILALNTCVVEAYLDKEKCLKSVFISARRPASPANTIATPPKPDRLIRLGELRRLFGPGQIRPAMLTKQEEWRRYPVEFSFLLSTKSREASIRASLPTPEYADSAMVDSISLFAQE